MQYFSTLPKIIKTDAQGNSLLMTNLMARASVIPQLLQNPAVFYTYDIQEGDKPETIAHKYYGDVNRFWIVLFSNQIIDPQWQWPLNNLEFDAYILDKYPSIDVYSTAYGYQKIITQVNSATNTTTTNIVNIDYDAYLSTPTGTNTINLPEGSVTITVETQSISIYDYEVQQNENNRNIRLIKSNYVNQLEQQLKSLMTQ